MRKAGRKQSIRQLTKLHEQSVLEEQRNRQLLQEETELLGRQRYVTGLADAVHENGRWERLTPGHVQKAFQETFGDDSVRHVHFRYRRPRRHGAGKWAGDSSDQPALHVEGAVVEFQDGKTAFFVESRRQGIITDTIQRGERCQTRRELLLQLNRVGAIRQCGADDSCRYVRLSPNKAPSSQYYHRGGAGQQVLLATRLQVGSLGPDGTTLITELDSHGTSGQTKVCIDYQKRHLSVLTQLRGQHLLVNNFRDLHHRLLFNRSHSTLTFTVTQPPRILEPFTGQCPGCNLTADWNLSGPIYQLAGDFTAPHRMGMELSGLCPLCAPERFLSEKDHGGSMRQTGPEIGSQLAGADGSLGRCFTYRIKLQDGAIKELDANRNELLRKLSSFGLLAPGSYYKWQSNKQPPTANSCGDAVPQAASGTVTDSSVTAADTISRKDFEAQYGPCRLSEVLERLHYMVAYNVLVLLSSGVATIWQVSTEEFEYLLRQSTPDMACQALSELALHRTPIRDLTKALEQQLLELAALQAEADSQQQDPVDTAQQYKILRVHVTPTRLKFLPAEVQSGNRVVRHFCSTAAYATKYGQGLTCLDWLQFGHTDFLRVGFGDEHGDRLLGGTREEVGVAFFRRMYYALSRGVVVNGQKFAFLAYSSSQLKTWACWMVADPNQNLPLIAVEAEQIAASLRLWLGDAMQTEHVPAKCAARLGQGFTTTVDATAMALHEVEEIPDIEGPGLYTAECVEGQGLVVINTPTYCFSDGVGRISNELLDAVLQDLPYASVDLGPISAIQIRFQGYKGVLSRYSPLRGRAIQLRPSMNKFGSMHPQLEAVSVAAYRPAYLNRQVIIMMNYNGVPIEAFTSKVEVLLSQLHNMTTSIDAALDLLPSLGSIAPGIVRLPIDNVVAATSSRLLLPTTTASASLLVSGAHDAMIRLLYVAKACNMVLDPLMSSCLRAVAQWQVTGLRKKARLLVCEGATLMGVLDEYGVLEGDEVFVQLQRPHRGRRTCGPPQILTGAVTLAKHPVAHRGDVRRVMAVNPAGRPGGQQLIDDYVNVVVFSQKGKRPLPHKLAGADLDGDQFQVLWDETLLQPSNSAPSDYNSIQPVRVPKVEVHHLQEHFVNFIRNDNLGAISNWLLAHADRDGADCEACDRLAELHSLAVDFPKTGRPAIMHPAERRRLMPYDFEWPHWLEKPERESYRSETVLGKIYDMVVAHPINQHLTGGSCSTTAGGDACQQADLDSSSSVSAGSVTVNGDSKPLAEHSPANNGQTDAAELSQLTTVLDRVTISCNNGLERSTVTKQVDAAELTAPAVNNDNSSAVESCGPQHSTVEARGGSSSSSRNFGCHSIVVGRCLPVHNSNTDLGVMTCGRQAALVADASSQPLWPEQLLQVPGISAGYKQHLQQAESHYQEFENDLIQLMNQSDICDVGEMLTGCVRWLQTLQHHQQWERKEHLLRELKAVFSTARRRFLEAVILLMGAASHKDDLYGISNRALETLVYEVFSSNNNQDAAGNTYSSTADTRLQLAAAYMVVGHKALFMQSAQHACPSGVATGVLGELVASHTQADEWADGSRHDEDPDDISDIADDDGTTAQHLACTGSQEQQQVEGLLDLTRKVHEIKLLTRLSFQWVVARELEELADWL